MPLKLIALVALLIILHQDNWFWEDSRLVFGFMPIGLFYHACISLAAAAVWFWAIHNCWPEKPEELIPQPEEPKQ